jgi:hypothetical protein
VLSILDLDAIHGIEPGLGLKNWVDHVKTWQLVVDTIVDARGQRNRVKSGMNLSGTRKIILREPEEFGPLLDKIVIDHCRSSLERASLATVRGVSFNGATK